MARGRRAGTPGLSNRWGDDPDRPASRAATLEFPGRTHVTNLPRLIHYSASAVANDSSIPSIFESPRSHVAYRRLEPRSMVQREREIRSTYIMESSAAPANNAPRMPE